MRGALALRVVGTVSLNAIAHIGKRMVRRISGESSNIATCTHCNGNEPEPKAAFYTLYNKGEFVVEAIDSILKGTYGDFEILIMDDASTDDGPAKVKAINDPRIRLVTAEKNGGRAAAANRGYEAARGEYIAILDADDTAHPERLAQQVAFMDAIPEIGVCGTAARYFGARVGIDRWPATDRECRAKLLFTEHHHAHDGLGLDQTAVEERETRCHEQHEGRADEHERGIALIHGPRPLSMVAGA